MNENKKVDFIIIGAMKSGTTSLANDLAGHPSVFFSVNKEPGYFNRDSDWKIELEEYHKLFRGASENQLWGEASTQYSMRPEYRETHTRLYEYNPGLRLLYIMRDPVKRIISNYAHNYVRKRVGENFQEVIGNNESYLTRSRFYYQLEPYLETFGRKNLHLLIFEEYITDPVFHLKSVANFLGLDPSFYNNYLAEVKNASTGRRILADGGIGKIFSPLKKIRHHIPEFIIDAGLKVFGNETRNLPEFPLSYRKELFSELNDDVLKLERLMGRRIDVWDKYD